MQHSSNIDPVVLEQAADWLMLLHSEDVTETEREACRRWQALNPEHARAWARAELLMNRVGQVPPNIAMPVLNRPASLNRRALLGKLAVLGLVVPAFWGTWRILETQGWSADHFTLNGQRKDLLLADGSQLMLNTSSAVDIHFDAERRLVRLRSGEILVNTAPDAHRPFSVATQAGKMTALGTRFTVRQYANGQTHLGVLEGAVLIKPLHADEQLINAGSQVTFTADEMSRVTSISSMVTAWTKGMLMADRMPLSEMIAELSRYHNGIVHCDPSIANVLVSGAFPLDDIDLSLRMLVATYPVKLSSRLRGYWITLGPS